MIRNPRLGMDIYMRIINIRENEKKNKITKSEEKKRETTQARRTKLMINKVSLI